MVEAVCGLLERVGYHVVHKPRRDAQIDPLLVNVNLLAQKPDHSLVVAVLGPGPDPPSYKWDIARRLHSAAFALGESGPEPQRPPKPIWPVLFYFGRDAEPELADTGKAFPIQIIKDARTVMAEASRTDDPAQLREIAEHALAFAYEGSLR